MKTSLFSLLLLFVFALPVQAQTKNAVSKPVTKELLQEIVLNNKKFTKEGKVADYIPELGKANPDDIAIAVVNKEGEIIEAGQVNQKFTMQSISKIIGLMLAVEDLGEDEVFDKLGYFGTNKPFNHYANLETDGKPLNPMMNAGAILITSLIKGEGTQPYERILERIRYITKNDKIQINQDVFLSEKSTGDRNRGIFYILKNNGLIEGDEENLDNYFRQCSIELNAADLAKIGYFFANHCTRFDGDQTYQSTDLGELIQSQMLIAGMYDYSGAYARKVGLPSKSGVGGGITVSVPNQMGIGVYSPALDQYGNSIAGYYMIMDLAQLLNLSLFR